MHGNYNFWTQTAAVSVNHTLVLSQAYLTLSPPIMHKCPKIGRWERTQEG